MTMTFMVTIRNTKCSTKSGLYFWDDGTSVDLTSGMHCMTLSVLTFEVLSSAVCTCYCHLLCMLRTNGPQFGLQAHLSLDKINSYRPIQYKCENDWYVKLGGWSINVVLKIRPRYMYRRHVVLKVSRVNEPKMFS